MTHQRFAVRLLAGLLPVALVLGASSAARAERVVTRDAPGDVLAAASLFDADPEALVPAPEATAEDIVRTVVDHRDRRLRVGVRFSDLQAPTISHMTVVRLITPRGRHALLVERAPGSKDSAVLMSSRGAEIRCPGLRWSAEIREDQVKVSVPTACIGAPRWVQVGVGAVGIDGDPTTEDADDLRVRVDDGHRDGVVRESSIGKGPKVRRG